MNYPLAKKGFQPPPLHTPAIELQEMLRKKISKRPEKKDTLKSLKIELELRNEVRGNIAHQRMIGSYVGLRHAMHLPVRGQNTQTNAATAKKLNRLERRG
jgi:small subunit ribosomal protein S13